MASIYPVVLLLCFSCICRKDNIKLLVGNYAKTGENGLSLFDFNPKEVGLVKLSESDAGPNPSYFCVSIKNGLIYAANEVNDFKGVKGGGITTLKYNDKSGIIEKISELNVPNGGPCFISLSPGEDYLFMANYAGGSVAVVRLDDKGIPISIADLIIYKEAEGKVSHAHMIASGPSGKRVYVTDLGLNRVVIYNFNSSTGQLQQIQNGIVSLPEGAGPRHFVFNSDGSKMYVINELNSTIAVFNVNDNGELSLIQSLTTLSEGLNGKSYCADIHLGKNGNYIYGSNRGENTIVTFRIESGGTLSLAGHTYCGGNWPRNFVIDPSGEYILVGNQRSGDISLLKIDKKTGVPILTTTNMRIYSPACLKFSTIK